MSRVIGIEILLFAIGVSITFRVILQFRRRRREDRFLKACGIYVIKSSDPMRSRLAGVLRYARRFQRSGLPGLQVPLDGGSDGALFAIPAPHGKRVKGE